VVLAGDDAAAMAGAACQFAQCRNSNRATLLVVNPNQDSKEADTTDIDPASTNDPLAMAVVAALPEEAHVIVGDPPKEEGDQKATEEEKPKLIVGLRLIRQPDVVHAVLSEVSRAKGELLLLPKRVKEPNENLATSPLVKLFSSSPCNTLLIRTDDQHKPFKRILVPVSGGPHANVALRLADKLARVNEGQVDALFVEPPIGDDATLVGQQILRRIIKQAVGDDGSRISPKVVIDADFRRGIARAAEMDSYDLLLVGNSNHWFSRQVLFSVIPAELVTGSEALTIAVVRRALPFQVRVRDVARRMLERMIPQLEREDRITLVERIQTSSCWNIDFVMLIALSTFIATLGLIQNSAAVVIGAMLIAPLMTPLMGAGLALVQGNLVLVRHASRSVLLGFVLALTIGFLLGRLVPGVSMTDQILARGSPNLLDLGVAFVSGIAGAYATARPNLSSALPGVAIAAALVPPISSVGLCLALGQPLVAAGAALLFLTNILAIMLGSAAMLYAVGVASDHVHGRPKRWASRLTLVLIVLTVIVAIPLSYVLYAALPRKEISDTIMSGLRDRVEQQANATVEDVLVIPASATGEPMQVRMTIIASKPASPDLAKQLARHIETEVGKPCVVSMHTKLTVVSGESDF